MPIRRVVAHEAVKADTGRVAFQRGPLVYCAEAIDNGGKALDLEFADPTVFSPEFRPDLLNGVVVLMKKQLASPAVLGVTRGRKVMLIPYYAWANRGPGEMRVWFPRI
jgi:hypothetical protein